MASPRLPEQKEFGIIVIDIDEGGTCDDCTLVFSSLKTLRSLFLRPLSLLEMWGGQLLVVRLEISDMAAIREGPLA